MSEAFPTPPEIEMTADLLTDFNLSAVDMMDLSSTPDSSTDGDSSTIPGYQLQEKMGSGVFGEAWKARQSSTGQGVVVKLFLDVEAEMLRELERVVRLGSHPYLINILDAKLSHDPPYLVTSLLRTSLSAWMKVHAHAAELNDRVSAWLQQAALGLSYVHRRGIIHCDINPQSLLLDSQEMLRLADFGLAHSYGNLEERETPDTLFLLPPEQVLASKNRGQGIEFLPTPGWDVYALGATFYYLLTSFYPRATPKGLRRLERCSNGGERLRDYWIQLQGSRLVPILDYNPGVHVRLAIIIERCLSLNPLARYGQAIDLMADLELRDQVPADRLDDALYSLRSLTHRLGF